MIDDTQLPSMTCVRAMASCDSGSRVDFGNTLANEASTVRDSDGLPCRLSACP